MLGISYPGFLDQCQRFAGQRKIASRLCACYSHAKSMTIGRHHLQTAVYLSLKVLTAKYSKGEAYETACR